VAVGLVFWLLWADYRRRSGKIQPLSRSINPGLEFSAGGSRADLE